eukprot:328731-Rhodomonas_salina.1
MRAGGAINVVEVGCGVGNTALPLLALNPEIKVWACDFSDNAVEYLKQSEGYDKDRLLGDGGGRDGDVADDDGGGRRHGDDGDGL